MLEFVDLCMVKLEGTLGVEVKYVWFMSYECELYVSQITMEQLNSPTNMGRYSYKAKQSTTTTTYLNKQKKS
jgi:hypothetical protein